MKTPMCAKALVVMLGLFCFSLHESAHAYIDPGTGSYLLQMLVASFFGAVFALGVFWRSVKVFCSTMVANVSSFFSGGGKGD